MITGMQSIFVDVIVLKIKLDLIIFEKDDIERSCPIQHLEQKLDKYAEYFLFNVIQLQNAWFEANSINLNQSIKIWRPFRVKTNFNI